MTTARSPNRCTSAFSRASTPFRCSTAAAGSDDYLMAWEWGGETEVEGSAEEAATVVAERYNNGFPHDFAARIRDLHAAGQRDPRPGTADHWIE